MKLKMILILFVFLINFGNAFCQKGLQNLKEYDYEPYHFGFLLAYNQMGFAIKVDNSQLNKTFPSTEFENSNSKTALLKSAEPNSTTGFTIGIIGNLRVAEHFDLRFIPSLSFGERNIIYNYSTQSTQGKIDTLLLEKSIKSTLLEFPLMLKYKGNRIENARPYILGGMKYVLDLQSDAKKNTDNQNGEFIVKLKQYDIYGELGAGFDFYFDWFKMGLEAKMSYGLRDILVRDNLSMYTSAINRLNSKIFQLSVTFE